MYLGVCVYIEVSLIICHSWGAATLHFLGTLGSTIRLYQLANEPQNLLVPKSPALGLQTCTIIPSFFTLVLVCFYGQHLTHWAISWALKCPVSIGMPCLTFPFQKHWLTSRQNVPFFYFSNEQVSNYPQRRKKKVKLSNLRFNKNFLPCYTIIYTGNNYVLEKRKSGREDGLVDKVLAL